MCKNIPDPVEQVATLATDLQAELFPALANKVGLTYFLPPYELLSPASAGALGYSATLALRPSADNGLG